MRRTLLRRTALILAAGTVLAAGSVLVGCGSVDPTDSLARTAASHASTAANSAPAPANSAPAPANSAPAPANSVPTPANSAPAPANSVPTAANSVPTAANSVPTAGNPAPANSLPTAAKPAPANPAPTAANPASTAAKTAAESSFPRTVTHDKGTTEIAARPQRIVALDTSLVEAVVLLKRPLVGGIGSYGDVNGFPPYLGDAVKDTVEVGPAPNPDMEAIAALKPDLIISATSRHDVLYDELSKIAPTVFVKTTGPQWQQNITTLGGVLGAGDEATNAFAAYKQRAKQVGDAINAKAGSPTISVVCFLEGPIRLMQKANFIGIILKDAGLSRPKSQDVEDVDVEVGEEEIRQADGGHVFVASFSGDKAAKERLERNPLWKELEGVKAGNVTDVPNEIWITSVSVQGAQLVLDDLAKTFGVDPARA